MSKQAAFLLGLAVAAGVWLAAPILRAEFAQIWFVGAGAMQAVVVHGNDLAAAAAGLAAWILALHFPKRPRRIAGIRHGTLEPVPWPPRFA